MCKKDRKDFCVNLEIVLPIDKFNGWTLALVYQTDVNFQEIELMKEEAVTYFDTLLVIVYVTVRWVVCRTLMWIIKREQKKQLKKYFVSNRPWPMNIIM